MLVAPRLVSDAPLIISVSGARGIVGRSLTPAVVLELSAAFGTLARESGGNPQPAICVGRDTRPSSQMLAAAATAGLTSVGARVIDLGVAATPTVAIMVKANAAAGGLVVTASHNPIEWNGLKWIGGDGIALAGDQVAEMRRLIAEGGITPVQARDLVPRAHDARGNDTHVSAVTAHVDRAAIRSARLKVVLDSGNGAGAAAARALLAALDVECIHLNAEPSGSFARGPEPVEPNVTELARTTAARGASIGFAQDPDGDRLALVDERGRFVGEQYTVVLAARRVFERLGGSPVVVNLSTSRLIDDMAARYPGASVIRTPVGEANVAHAMRDAGAVIGGEGNGGVIFSPVGMVRDSISAMALVLDLMAASGSPPSGLVAEYPGYTVLTRRFELAPSGNERLVARATEDVAHRYADERIDTCDGVRVDFAEGWVHLRASNTEPIIRLIAEAKTMERANKLADEVSIAAGLK